MLTSNQWRPGVSKKRKTGIQQWYRCCQQVTSPPPSLPELDSESHHSLREALQGEHVQVPSDVSSRPDSDCSHRTVLPDAVSREMEEKVQNVRVFDSDPLVKPLDEQKQSPDDSTTERQSSSQTRERTF